jgi:hypothetical protein
MGVAAALTAVHGDICLVGFLSLFLLLVVVVVFKISSTVLPGSL